MKVTRRNQIKTIALGAALLMSAATPVHAQKAEPALGRSNWFVRNCGESGWELPCLAFTIGYFVGSQTRSKTICLPEGVDNGQLHTMAMNYMKAHPEKGHLAGTTLMDEVWEATFPCKK